MTEYLVKQAENEILKNNLPTAGEGTLKTRMLYFKDNLRAKQEHWQMSVQLQVI